MKNLSVIWCSSYNMKIVNVNYFVIYNNSFDVIQMESQSRKQQKPFVLLPSYLFLMPLFRIVL